jgi:hypothetical protein
MTSIISEGVAKFGIYIQVVAATAKRRIEKAPTVKVKYT